MIYIVLLIILYILYLLYDYAYYKYKKNSNNDFHGNINKCILTNNELNFYKQLKFITDKYNLIIFCKVRIADIISVKNYSDFNKIKAKHIDFIICNNDTSPLLFIELDDNTHNKYKNHQNDIKKDNILYSVGYKIIRIKVKSNYNLEEIENKIKTKLLVN